MERVSFDEEPQYERRSVSARVTAVTGLVLKTGLAKTETQARYVLIAIAVGAIVLASGLLIFIGGETIVPIPNGIEQRQFVPVTKPPSL